MLNMLTEIFRLAQPKGNSFADGPRPGHPPAALPGGGGFSAPMNPLAALLLGLLLLGSGCAGPTKSPPASAAGEYFASIYVVNHGKHTGLTLRRGDIPPGLWPESGDFAGADYVELGWGDWDYYQADEPGLWVTLKAALWPTASVLHVAGIRGSVADWLAGYEVVRFDLTRSAFGRLADYIHRSVDRHGAARVEPLDPGHVGDSHFYPARGKFHLFNTCNGWTARALEAAGYPMGLFRPVTADQLMAKAGRFGVIVTPGARLNVQPLGDGS